MRHGSSSIAINVPTGQVIPLGSKERVEDRLDLSDRHLDIPEASPGFTQADKLVKPG